MASLRSINQDDLRNHNLSVVLDSLLRATEPMSRADLAKKTGLTKAAMSVLVSLMLDNEILVEGAPSTRISLSSINDTNTDMAALVNPVFLARSARLIGSVARNSESSTTERLWFRKSS